MPNQSVRITKKVVENAPVPERGQAFIRDIDLKGFALRITASGTRSYIIEKRIEGVATGDTRSGVTAN